MITSLFQLPTPSFTYLQESVLLCYLDELYSNSSSAVSFIFPDNGASIGMGLLGIARHSSTGCFRCLHVVHILLSLSPTITFPSSKFPHLTLAISFCPRILLPFFHVLDLELVFDFRISNFFRLQSMPLICTVCAPE